MAGIGFELKKLFNKKSAAGYFSACSYTSFVTTGPFMLIVGMVLGIQLLYSYYETAYLDMQLYTASVIYCFVFSHIITSGFSMLITRYIADRLYVKAYDDITASLYGMCAIAVLVGSLLGGIWFWLAELSLLLEFATYIFFTLLMVMWIQVVYLTAIKDYKLIMRSYLIGVIIALGGVWLVLQQSGLPLVSCTLLCMDLGLLIINILLLCNIRAFFPKASNDYFAFLDYFATHYSLFWINFTYTLGLYIPNIIFWQSELQMVIANTYVCAPQYDVATFYGLLSIMPIMVMFIVSTEVHFYDKYARYFMYVTEKGNFKQIDESRKELFNVMWSEIRNIIEFQLVFTLIFLALGNSLLPKVGLDYYSIGMYNLILLGAYAAGVMQILTILMLYFEDRRGTLRVCSLFLFSNIVLSCLSLMIGSVAYGFGFFLASFITLMVALRRIDYLSKHIDYFVFCSMPVFTAGPQGIFHMLRMLLAAKKV